MQLHYYVSQVRTFAYRTQRIPAIQPSGGSPSQSGGLQSIRSRSARRWGRCSLLFRFSPDVGQPCRFALAAVVGCCCAGERSGTVPASSSVVWPAYGAVRARDVGRDRMDLMYSPMLVRFYYIIVNSCPARRGTPPRSRHTTTTY